MRADTEKSFSSTIHKIAVASVGFSLAIMIIAFLVLFGFQDSIRQKIFSLSSHILVTKYTMGGAFENHPLSENRRFFREWQDYEFIDHIQQYSYKTGLLKTDEEILGVMLKGVGPDFDSLRFRPNMLEGNFIQFREKGYSSDIVLSRKIANLMQVDVGDDILIWFFQNPPRARKLEITGIYETGMEELDSKIIIGDIGMIQRLNDWADTLVGGYEVYLEDYNMIDQAASSLYEDLDYDMSVEKVTDKYYQNFEWLTMLNKNVIILLVIIMIVASFNMISIVMIMIMERTQMIGMLKAFGARDNVISRIFMYSGLQLIVKGLLIGNSLGLGLAWLQYKFRLIPLDPENYYMSFVPIEWNWTIIIALNLLTLIMISLVLLAPTRIISRIQPIRTIRFD